MIHSYHAKKRTKPLIKHYERDERKEGERVCYTLEPTAENPAQVSDFFLSLPCLLFGSWWVRSRLRRCRGAPVVDELGIGAFWWTEVVVVAATAFPRCWGLTTLVSSGAGGRRWIVLFIAA